MKINVVTQNVAMTQMMQRLDVFETFKVMLGPTIEVVADLVEPHTLTEALQDLHTTYDESQGKDFKAIAVFVPGNPEGAWRDPNIKCVSTGQKWGLMTEYLKALGYVETR